MNSTANEDTVVEALLQLQSGNKKGVDEKSRPTILTFAPHLRICQRCNMSWTLSNKDTPLVHNITKILLPNEAKIMVHPNPWQHENMRITPNIVLYLSSEICVMPNDILLWLEWIKLDATKGTYVFSEKNCNLVRSESAIMFFDIVLPLFRQLEGAKEGSEFSIMIKLGDEILPTHTFRLRNSVLQPWMVDPRRPSFISLSQPSKPKKKKIKTF